MPERRKGTVFWKKTSGRFFKKKLRKKLLFTPAFERPYCDRSKAGRNKKVFWLLFFKKVTASFASGSGGVPAGALRQGQKAQHDEHRDQPG
jgi:hypothetical protein